MVVKVYVSGISGNKEVKKQQQRVLMILESKGVACEVVDITEPGRESDKEFMQKNSKTRGDMRYPLPPQLFNEEDYCGDYDDFDLSNENDELEKFLKVPVAEKTTKNGEVNGVAGSRETSTERVVEAETKESTEESNKTAPAEEPATGEVVPTENTQEEAEEEQAEEQE